MLLKLIVFGLLITGFAFSTTEITLAQEPTDTPTPTPAIQGVPVQISRVVAVLRRTEVGTGITLRLYGTIPDGCDIPVSVDQRLTEDGDIVLNVYRVLPEDVYCPMVILPFEDIVRLDGFFTEDSYRLIVNGQVYRLHVAASG
ncbi:MAG: hypothetical protein ACOYL5_16590 [Phototrophicaceae bacterium]|jgi:hypothetical protein